MTLAQTVLYHCEGAIAYLTLNRPDKRNALNIAVWLELNRHLDVIEAQTDDILAVVLRGSGPSFCAGNDLAEFGDPPAPNYQSKTVTRLAGLPQPVIVAVQGGCYTGGLELALAGDIIIAAENARFADTHGKFALVPIWGMTQRLPRRVGTYKAREISFTGIPVGGAEAERIGLANICVRDEALKSKTQEIAEAIAGQSPHSLFALKKLYNEQQDLGLGAGLAYEISSSAGRGPDFAERVSSYSRQKK